MSGLFYNCSSLKDLDLSNFNTNNVTDMSDMFHDCSSLKELNLSNFNINNVIDISCMFHGCTDELELKITSVDDTVTEFNRNWEYYPNVAPTTEDSEVQDTSNNVSE